MKRLCKLLKIKTFTFPDQGGPMLHRMLRSAGPACPSDDSQGPTMVTPRMSICLPTESDSAPTEGGINKLFTTIMATLRVFGPHSLLELSQGQQVSHVAGAHNEWADDLSRGRLQAFAHRPQDRFRVPLQILASAASEATWTSRTQTTPLHSHSNLAAYDREENSGPGLLVSMHAYPSSARDSPALRTEHRPR